MEHHRKRQMALRHPYVDHAGAIDCFMWQIGIGIRKWPCNSNIGDDFSSEASRFRWARQFMGSINALEYPRTHMWSMTQLFWIHRAESPSADEKMSRIKVSLGRVQHSIMSRMISMKNFRFGSNLINPSRVTSDNWQNTVELFSRKNWKTSQTTSVADWLNYFPTDFPSNRQPFSQLANVCNYVATMFYYLSKCDSTEI